MRLIHLINFHTYITLVFNNVWVNNSAYRAQKNAIFQLKEFAGRSHKIPVIKDIRYYSWL